MAFVFEFCVRPTARASRSNLVRGAGLLGLLCVGLVVTGCTLDNSVHDTDANTPPPNVFQAPNVLLRCAFRA